MSEAKRMSDKSARNREDMLEALADDIERYALLSARETENVFAKMKADILISTLKSKVEKLRTIH